MIALVQTVTSQGSVRLNEETRIKAFSVGVAISPERLLNVFITSKSLNELIKREHIAKSLEKSGRLYCVVVISLSGFSS